MSPDPAKNKAEFNVPVPFGTAVVVAADTIRNPGIVLLGSSMIATTNQRVLEKQTARGTNNLGDEERVRPTEVAAFWDGRSDVLRQGP